MKRTLIIVFLVIILTINLYKTFNFLWADISIIKNFPFMTYDQKMHEKYGFYYDFMLFVKNNTPSNAVILIPPSQPPWAGSGNPLFSNYFLYPRKLISGDINNPSLNFKNFTYVFIVWKDFEATGLEKLYGWPKFKVPAREVLYMATDSSKLFKSIEKDYLPNDEINIGRYGLIKL